MESRETPAVGGFVFQDYNGNGTFDTSLTIPNLGGTDTGNKLNTPAYIGSTPVAQDIGVKDVTVTIYDALGNQVGQTKTDSTGKWNSNVSGGPFRVEFTTIPAGLGVGSHGASNGTPTQFIVDNTLTASLGLINANEYFRTTPLIATSQYGFGDAANGPDAAQLGILSFPYNAGASQLSDPGNVQNQGGLANNQTQSPNQHAIAIPFSEVGTTWGLGYNRAQKRGYAATFTKRHSGYGPGGAGAIYQFALPTNDTPNAVTTASVWLNLQGATARQIGSGGALGAPYTVDVKGTFANYIDNRGSTTVNLVPGLPANPTQFDVYDRDGDNTGWDAVGKTSLGGLDVSDDGSTVYVMNLADRRLYIIPVNPTTGAADTANIRSIPVPVPTAVAGAGRSDDMRPWAVEFHNGLVYVGTTDTSASAPSVRSNLRGYVFAFNPATNSFGGSLVNEPAADGFDLSYERGVSYQGSDNFLAWRDTYSRVRPNTGGAPDPGSAGRASAYPQAILSGLAFGSNGSLSISIRDRNGDQVGRGTLSNGAENVALNSTGGITAGRTEGISAGELLRAFPGTTPGAFVIEQAGANPNNAAEVGTGPASGEGPAGGEFYDRDDYGGGDPNTHNSTSLGGIAAVPGFGTILNTHYDPLLNGPFRSGGVRWFTTSNGKLEKSYMIYDRDQFASGPSNPAGTAGKANGLGDLIAFEAEDPPIEIGNRVFRDLDNDGIQDANEQGIDGVTVQLQSSAGAVLATATTANGGQYYFNSGVGTDTASEKYGIAALKAGGTFKVVIPNVTGGSQQAKLSGLAITQENSQTTGNPANPDAVNFDLRDSDFTVPALSTNAVVTVTLGAPGNSAHQSADAGFIQGVNLGDFVWVDANNNGTFDTGEAGLKDVVVNIYKASAQTTVFLTTKTGAAGDYKFSGLLPGDYIVEIVGPAGFRSSSGGGTDLVNGQFESGLTGNSPTNNEDHGKAISGNIATGFTIRANQITLSTTDNLVQDFGLVPVYSLGNRVWLDKNNSGTIDGADGSTPGIDGVTVKLYRPTDFDASGNLSVGKTEIASTKTAGGGYYRFDNLLGAASANDLTGGSYVVVVDGASTTLTGRISSTGTGKVFEPAPNAQGVVNTTDSDDNGTTAAGNLIRSGTVILGPGANAPTGETDLAADAQGNADNLANMTVDFGFFDPLSLGNRVFEDKNNNGKLDGTDAGIDGVTVTLFAADGAGNPSGAALGTTTTKSGGYYLFTGLGEGQYVVQVAKNTLPAGVNWQSSTGKNGSLTGPYEPPTGIVADNEDHGKFISADNVFRSGLLALAAGKATTGEVGGTPGFTDPASDANSELTIDFGVYRPLSIGNFVWNDKNNSGTVDAGDGANPGIGNVNVRLFFDANNDGTLSGGETTAILTAKTTLDTVNPANSGYYLFSNLAEGKYFVEIDTPAGFVTSTGNNTEPAPANLANVDNKDVGTAQGSGATIRSGLVTLTGQNQPTGEGATPGLDDIATDKDANYTADFGVFQTLQVGNLVFLDVNNNGKLDAGESGVNGAKVELLDSAGAPTGKSTTTGTDGKYLFSDLSPGKYQIRITPPAGLSSSTGKNGSPTGPNEPVTIPIPGDNNDQGTQSGTVITAPQFELFGSGDPQNPDSAGTANLRQDFGLVQLISIGDIIFEDKNNNGCKDVGETGLAGSTVTLLDSTGAVVGSPIVTDSTGKYLFTNLAAGKYTVQVTAPTGFVNSTDPTTPPTDPTIDCDVGTPDPTNPGKATNTQTYTASSTKTDFGFYRPLSLGNLVFIDANNNGKLDTGEKGLAGVTVDLIRGGSKIATTTTDTNGNYLFNNLTAGDYTINVTPPAKFVSSSGSVGKLTGPYEPATLPDVDNEDQGTTTGLVISASVTLAASGNPSKVTTDGDANLQQDFGLYQPVTLGNFVWNDVNNNGKFDAGESAVGDVAVDLLDKTGTVLASAKTDANGLYSFPVVAGVYTVRITPPSGFISSNGNGPGISTNGPYEPATGKTENNEDHGTTAGTFITTEPVTVAAPGDAANPDDAGFANLRQDFGIFTPVLFTLGDIIFQDLNQNGCKDAGEPGLANVTVNLLNAAGTIVQTAVTGADGKYTFTNLPPGQYTVQAIAPSGFVNSDTPTNPDPAVDCDTGTPDPTNPNKASTAVTLSKSVTNVDFGFFVPAPLTIGDTIFIDVNGNGCKDPGEVGLGGVTVNLLDAGGTILQTVVTDGTGKYNFGGLAKGTYTVQVVAPAGFTNSPTPTTPDPTTDCDVGTPDPTSPNKASNTITLTSSVTNQDFGFIPPPEPLSIGDRIFEDLNANGCREIDEPGIAGVTVNLLDATGAVVRTVVTGTDGKYLFDNLTKGTYTVQVVTPAGFRNSDTPTVADPNLDCDVGTPDPGNPGKVTSSVNLTTSTNRQDFGFVRRQSVGNLVFIDTNNNGVLDTGESGKAGVSVSLINAAGQTVASGATDSAGKYLFNDVLPGTYTVRITPPVGFISSTGKNVSLTGPAEPGFAQTDTRDSIDRGTTKGAAIETNFSLLAGTGNPDGADNFRQDFGLFQPVSVGDTVFTDLNKNGTKDSNDPAVSGVTIRLLNPDGSEVATTKTDTAGKYLFSTVTPGKYIVELTPPTGQSPTPVVVAPTANTGNQNTGTTVGTTIRTPVIDLQPGQAPLIEGNADKNAFVNADFGLTGLAKLSGFVYRDTVIDGKFVPGTTFSQDSPIGGVTVSLFDAAGKQVAVARTDSRGFYQFTDLPPGTYTIRETQPAGLLYDGIDTPGIGGTTPANDTIQVTLAANDNNVNNNFGEIPPASVNGNVYEDLNRNGTREFGETPIPNTIITIAGTAFAGTILSRPLTAADVPGGLTITTGPDGRWEFPSLPPGNYTITQTQPANFEDGLEQNADPVIRPQVGNDIFTNVVLGVDTINGPLNFGEINPNVPPNVPPPPSGNDPTKQNFLGSSNNNQLPPSPPPPPSGPRPNVQLLPNFTTTTGNPAITTLVVASNGVGRSSQVRVFDFGAGIEKFRLTPYEANFTGGVRLATGDVNGDGVEDVAVSTGIGGGPRVRIFSGVDGTQIREFFAFEETFRGGTFVAIGDVNGDGAGDVIVGAEVGGGPRITTFSGRDGTILNNFFAFDSTQRGGTRVAAGDFNADGKMDIVASTGAGVPTRVRVFDGTNVSNQLQDFAPFEAAFTGGVNLAVGDYNGDGRPDIVTGAEVGGGPRVQVFDGKTLGVLANTFAFESTATGGVRVAAQDINGDARADLVVIPGSGAARVRILRAGDLTPLEDFFAFDTEFLGGGYVG